MPKTTINEIDSSRYTSNQANAPMVILIPGTASFGPVFTATNPKVSTFSGTNGLSEFYNLYGTKPAETSDGKSLGASADDYLVDLSFEYVTNLLSSGATVQFFRLNNGESAYYSASDDDTKLITAKYTGTTGNRLLVQLSKLNDTTGVISIYRNLVDYSKDATYDDNYLKKLVKLLTVRVSTDSTSEFYVERDLQYIEITPANLKTLLAGLTNSNSRIYALSGGSDFTSGESEQQGKAILDLLIGKDAKSEDSVFMEFVDQYLFDFDFVTSGGLIPCKGYDTEHTTEDTLEKLHEAMIALSTERKDNVSLLDVNKEMTADELVDYVSKSETTLSRAFMDTSFAGIYAPWCSIVSNTTSNTLYMPASFIFLKALLRGMQNQIDSQLWYVPAGVARTSAPFIVEPYYEIGSTVLNKFQNDNNYRINPIMKLRNYGYCVYGNATCKVAVKGAKHSALESMNVRIISNVIKKHIFEVCCGLSFEYNNSSLWLKFYSQMDERLSYMKRNYGLYDYKIIMDNSTVTTEAMNERRIPGKVLISPNLAGEFFDIDFEIMPSGVSFGKEE